jgi:hypothetical protein
LRFHWVDEFNEAERNKLQTWVHDTQAALVKLVGDAPFDTHIYLHRRGDAAEPVPWANTERGPTVGVSFYVDPGYALGRFRGDWTAPHELSHLVLPYVGPDAGWFAEGFASYMQYQVMRAMGVISAAEVGRRYRERLDSARRDYRYADRPFAEAAPRLRQERKYPVMYWGGAAYFLRVDAELGQSGSSLMEVMRRYLACCRSNRDSIDALVRELDRLGRTEVFTRVLARFRTEPGFPEYDDGAR